MKGRRGIALFLRRSKTVTYTQILILVGITLFGVSWPLKGALGNALLITGFVLILITWVFGTKEGTDLKLLAKYRSYM